MSPRWSTFSKSMCHILLAVVCCLWSAGPASAVTPGTCDLDITLNPPLPNVFKISSAFKNHVPFFTSLMTINANCLGPFTVVGGQPVFIIDMAYNTYAYPVASLSGVVPKIVFNNGSVAVCSAFSGVTTNQQYSTPVGNRISQDTNLPSGQTCQALLKFDFSLATNGNGFNSNLASTANIYGLTAGNFSYYLSPSGAVPVKITNSDGSIKPYFMAEQVCTFSSNIVNVTLPNISSAALGNIPNSTTLGQTAFTIGLTACPTFSPSLNFSYLSLANVSFTTPSASDKTLLSNTTEVANGGAGNVYVQLLDANKAPIQTGQAVPMTQNGNTTFYAQYITAATGTVTPGLVTGIANITMSYK